MPGPYRIPFSSPGSVNSNFDALCGYQLCTGATDVIAIKEGFVLCTSSGVDAMTLAAPAAGLPSAGGDDGKILTIKVGSAHAHTVTTPANAINGADDTITFTNALANFITLRAGGGTWWTLGNTGGTLTEV